MSKFYYGDIRDFAFTALASLRKEMLNVRSLCLTLHGAEFGLDENETFQSEVIGLVDAITKGEYPESLIDITIAEIDNRRAGVLEEILKTICPSGYIEIGNHDQGVGKVDNGNSGLAPKAKPFIFVAMPFDGSMDDIFHYGIQRAVMNAGFLCERADLTSFTGGIMERVKKRIKESKLIIADLTNLNANVYLEVGYAWGREKPTLLLVQDPSDLKFDIKGHRCLKYKKIKELEDSLSKEFKNLKPTLLIDEDS